MKECEGFLGYVFGHNFQPVITKGKPSGNFDINNATPEIALSMVEASKPEIYHGLYCRRCGLRHE